MCLFWQKQALLSGTESSLFVDNFRNEIFLLSRYSRLPAANSHVCRLPPPGLTATLATPFNRLKRLLAG